MNSFYTYYELKELGLKKFGKDVLISRKASIYGAGKISIGDNVRIDDFCILSGKITLESHIHIAAYTALYGNEAGITIKDFANISSRICIYGISDDYTGETMTSPVIPEKYKNLKKEPVVIGKHVIIATNCTVLPGVNIADGSAFGAMSLINHDSEPWSINVGIPFKKIKDRSKKLLELEAEFKKECLK